jgi:hypothetical protein
MRNIIAAATAIALLGLVGCKPNTCTKLQNCCNAVNASANAMDMRTLGARAVCGAGGATTTVNAGNREACSSTLDSIRRSLAGTTVPAECQP